MKNTIKRRVAAGLLTGALSVGFASSMPITGAEASGTNNQFAHTLMTNDSGADVYTVQWLLNASGVQTAADGNFGPGTKANVIAFQKKNGLSADGVVGPATWGKLYKTVQPGAANNTWAVKAVQGQLANKYRSVAIDGQYGPSSQTAVKDFQRSVGLTGDGVVGPATWSRLVGHFAKASSRWSCYYSVNDIYGTAAAVSAINKGAAEVMASYGKVAIGDISHLRGGDIGGHASHEVGLDADVRPMRDNNDQCSAGTTWQSASYDRTATRALVKAMRATGQVKLVLFNDPQLISEGLTTRFDGHDDHLHFRFYEQGVTQDGISYSR